MCWLQDIRRKLFIACKPTCFFTVLNVVGFGGSLIFIPRADEDSRFSGIHKICLKSELGFVNWVGDPASGGLKDGHS